MREREEKTPAKEDKNPPLSCKVWRHSFKDLALDLGLKLKTFKLGMNLKVTELIYPGQVLKIVLETGVDL